MAEQNYQVMARKWRPQVFDELVGQTHISQTLLNALRQKRIPHALLFTGPRGTGKTSTARIVAKSLRCPKAKDFVPCNTCSECEDIANSRSIDVIEIDGASHNGVDAIRELRESVGFMPSSGTRKVYIIDEVHMLTGSAFNALLKTLEEPPPHVLFILATTEVHKIPNTVLSRCQRYDFRKISTRLISEHLQELCRREKVKFEPEAVWAIARQGDGSMRDSQSLLDQVINFADGNLTLKKVVEVLGLTDRGLLAAALTALIERDQKAVVTIIENIFSAGYDPLLFLKDLLEEIRHALLVKISPGRASELVDLPDEEIKRLSALADKLTEEDLHLLFDMALKGSQDLHRAQDSRIVLEMVLLRMSIAPRIASLANLRGLPTSAPQMSTSAAPSASLTPQAPAARASATNNRTSANAAANSAPPVETSEATAAATPSGSLSDRWTDFVDKVRKVNGLVAAQLEQLHLLKVDGTSIELGVPEKYKFLAGQADDPAFIKKVTNYLNTFWGPGHKVKIGMIDPKKTGSMNANHMQEQKEKESKDEVRRQVEEHPLVRQAKSIFNTDIKSIRENS